MDAPLVVVVVPKIHKNVYMIPNDPLPNENRMKMCYTLRPSIYYVITKKVGQLEVFSGQRLMCDFRPLLHLIG